MNKMIRSMAILTVLAFPSIYNVSAQDAAFRKFGIGVAYSPFDMTSISGSAAVMPITGINFVFNANPDLRSELTFGLSNMDFKTDKERMNMFSAGIGLFYTKRFDSSLLMGGFRFEYLSGKAEAKTDFGQNIDSEINRLSYGPAFAFEHLFNKHIGLGAEVGVRGANYEETTRYPGLPDFDYEVNAFYMQNTIFIRGYF
ncbi:MAG: hypothetical protein ACKOX7_10895 [Bacteroidota bacterium]